MTVSAAAIVAGIRRLDLSGRPVCIHCSFRSFGEVDGGPRAVIDAFLAERATVLVPAFSWSFRAIPPEDQRPQRNGGRYEFAVPHVAPDIYTPASTVIDSGMGALAAGVVNYDERQRGLHPLCSFAAVGPLAAELITGQAPNDVWAPLESLALRDGAVLLMGVDLTRLTLAHVAEKQAGRHPFLRWARDSSGSVMSVEVGGCSDGFRKFGRVLSPLSTATKVGRSRWTSVAAMKALDLLVQSIREEPLITQCDNPECDRCRDAVAGGPLV